LEEVVRRAILERIMIEEGIEDKSWDVVRRASEDAARCEWKSRPDMEGVHDDQG
jgi:hypothetical protein